VKYLLYINVYTESRGLGTAACKMAGEFPHHSHTAHRLSLSLSRLSRVIREKPSSGSALAIHERDSGILRIPSPVGLVHYLPGPGKEEEGDGGEEEERDSEANAGASRFVRAAFIFYSATRGMFRK